MPLSQCKKLIFYGIWLLFPAFSVAQSPIPDNLFSSPLNIPLKVGGTFGELRGNHFHSGLDLKTEGRQGLTVKAAAAGWVSRVKISADGFGKVIYINHPEGFTTVYAHLYCFNAQLQHFADSLQLAQQKFEIEFFPDSTLFPVQRGEIIGLSGSSGGSEAPHLHFEIRNRKTEIPMNPLLAGLPITDTIAPVIKKLFFYAFADGRWEREKVVDVSSKNHALPIDTFSTSLEKIAFGVLAIDSDSASTNGIYSASVYKNDKLIFSYSFNQFSFDESSHLNAHVDYEWQQLTGEKIHRLFRLPGDSCSVYLQQEDGSTMLSDTVNNIYKIYIEDFSKNKDSILVVAKKNKNVIVHQSGLQNRSLPLQMNLPGFTGTIPAFAFYQNANVDVKVLTLKKINKKLLTRPMGFSSTEPMKKKATFQYKVPLQWCKYADKLFLANVSEDGAISIVVPAKYDKGWLNMQSLNSGFYAMVIDTVSPVFLNMDAVADPVKATTLLQFHLKDDCSGIKSFQLFIDGHWTLTEYNSQMTQLITQPPTNIGPHVLRMEYSDKANNKAVTEIGY